MTNQIEKPTILVVDDAQDVLSAMNGLLGDDYFVKLAISSEKALCYLDKHSNVDLILLDILMPDIDGFELCKILKSKNEFKHIPIIFLTALDKESDVIKGFDLGAVDYVAKPFEPKVLKARVKAHIELKKFRDEILKNLQQKEDLLLKQSKMASLGEMFESIAHQWKQPLSVINMSCANLKLEQELGEVNKEVIDNAIEIIESEVKHLSQTVSDFRDFIRDSGEKDDFDLHSVIDHAINLIHSKLKNRSITVNNQIPNITLYTYKNDFIQVLMNILSNAIDALERVHKERYINIDARTSENQIIITICDNGGGIEDDIFDTIFNKYVTTKIDKGGTGIGLYMCAQIMNKRVNGEIRAYNKDDGACFELTFPIY